MYHTYLICRYLVAYNRIKFCIVLGLCCVILYHQHLYTNMYTTTLLDKEIILKHGTAWICTGSEPALYWLCTGSVLALFQLSFSKKLFQNLSCLGSASDLHQLCSSSVPALFSVLAPYPLCTGSVSAPYRQLCTGSSILAL